MRRYQHFPLTPFKSYLFCWLFLPTISGSHLTRGRQYSHIQKFSNTKHLLGLDSYVLNRVQEGPSCKRLICVLTKATQVRGLFISVALLLLCHLRGAWEANVCVSTYRFQLQCGSESNFLFPIWGILEFSLIEMTEIIHIVHNISVVLSLIVFISNSRVQLKGTYPVSIS